MYDDGRHLWKHWMWFYLSMLRDNKKNLEFCGLSFRNLQIISWLLTPMGSQLTRLAGWGEVIDQLPPTNQFLSLLKHPVGKHDYKITDYEVHEAQVKYSKSKGHSIALLKVLGSFCWTLVGHKAFLVKFCRSWAILFDFWKAYDHSLWHL